MTWKREWFINLPKHSPSYWNSQENQRNFMDAIAMQYNIRSLGDWQKVTVSLIKGNGGKVSSFLLFYVAGTIEAL